MNRELEQLINALDAALEACPATEARARFDALIREALEERPGLDETALRRAVTLAHSRWLRAQRTPTNLPPNA